MDYKGFVSKPKSMLIAPAGYGKTHTIVECLKYTTGKQLILTHTHAGIASIKEKLKNANIVNANVSVETISGFAQKYVLAFCKKDVVPDQSNRDEYYPFIIKKATELLRLKTIASIVAASYSGVFVDEYQDCTNSQHDLIVTLSDILPTRILGDHLQGIFEFGNDSLVDLTSADKMCDFLDNKIELTEPRRWENHNKELGATLKLLRASIEAKQSIDLGNHPSIELLVADELDLYDSRSDYSKKIWSLRNEVSLLLIHPDSYSINPRKKVIGAYKNSFQLVEAIDDKDFYSITQCLDSCTPDNLEKVIRNVCYELFNPTVLNVWFNEKGFKNKTKEAEIALVNPAKQSLVLCKKSFSFKCIANIIRQIKKLPDIVCYRSELLNAILKSLEDADLNSISVSQAMLNKRNQTRRLGRSVDGRSIGTTLLTKGLEFDTVVILNAHKFTCPKNLYVALTRAKKRLIVFTKNKTLAPYK